MTSENRPAVQVGDAALPRTVGPLTRFDFARFSIATDDPNLLHIDDAVARAAGFPEVIGSGLIVGAILTDVVGSWLGFEFLRTASVQMLAPLTLGLTLVAGATVSSADDSTLTVDAQLLDDAGATIGTARFMLAPTG